MASQKAFISGTAVKLEVLRPALASHHRAPILWPLGRASRGRLEFRRTVDRQPVTAALASTIRTIMRQPRSGNTNFASLAVAEALAPADFPANRAFSHSTLASEPCRLNSKLSSNGTRYLARVIDHLTLRPSMARKFPSGSLCHHRPIASRNSITGLGSPLTSSGVPVPSISIIQKLMRAFTATVCSFAGCRGTSGASWRSGVIVALPGSSPIAIPGIPGTMATRSKTGAPLPLEIRRKR